MTKHRFLALIASAGIALSMTSGVVRADRVFFSEVGLPVKIDPQDEFSRTIAPEPLAPTQVPSVQMQVGEERTLSIWVLPEGPSHIYSSLGWDIDSSNGAVAHLIGHTVLNPQNFSDASELRWQGVVGGVEGPAGSTDWLTNTRAVSVVSGGGVGRGAPAAAVNDDQGRDNTTGAFYLGDITFRADAPGTTGLYLRTGEVKWIYKGSGAPGELQYGASSAIHIGNVVGSGDPITGDLAEADAIIMVAGEPTGVSAMLTAHDGTDTSGDIVIDSVGNTFLNFTGATSGRINILNFLGDGSGDLPLFFDLVEGANAAQLVSDLNAAAAGAFTAELSTFSAPNAGGGSSTADIVIRYPGVAAGGNFFIDFNFGDVGVAAVGVPEPSSMALVAMSLVGLVGYGIRRRRV